MKKVINLYKPSGMTPLQALEKFRENNPTYCGKKISYPGRLDPIAEGVLILLVGDENKKMKDYMKLDKEYVAEIVLGFETDSHDILGMPKRGERKDINTGISLNPLPYEIPVPKTSNGSQEVFDIKYLKKKIKSFKGSYDMEVPVYSSIKVNGRALFSYARKNKLGEIEIPQIKVKIKNIQIDYIYEITGKKLLKEIIRKIDLVKGDFRQEEIKMRWKLLLENSDEKFKVIKIFVRCSSGTYIRALARDIGKEFGGGVLLSLKRTKVGKFCVKDSMRI